MMKFWHSIEVKSSDFDFLGSFLFSSETCTNGFAWIHWVITCCVLVGLLN